VLQKSSHLTPASSSLRERFLPDFTMGQRTCSSWVKIVHSRSKSATENTVPPPGPSPIRRTIPDSSAEHGADFHVASWPSGEPVDSPYSAPVACSQSPLATTSVTTFLKIRKLRALLSPLCVFPNSQKRAPNFATVHVVKKCKELVSITRASGDIITLVIGPL
jgi:hypothetical protein